MSYIVHTLVLIYTRSPPSPLSPQNPEEKEEKKVGKWWILKWISNPLVILLSVGAVESFIALFGVCMEDPSVDCTVVHIFF